VAQLEPEERDKLLAYLNFDMVGSPNYIRAIYDGDGTDSTRMEPFGSGTLEWAFKAHFDALELPHEPIGDVIYRRSDHASFSEAGIPVGGLFSGFNVPKTAEQAAKYGGQEGASQDPCYHQPCDSIDNVNVEGLEIMADAIAHSVLHFAFDEIFPLASGRAYPAQQPGAGTVDLAAAEAELARALSALSAEGGCAAALAAHAAEHGYEAAPHGLEDDHVHLPTR
jgi:Zn-dependent M28 family amino/carboxypeptidase